MSTTPNKNNAKGSFKTLHTEDDLKMLIHKNEEDSAINLQHDSGQHAIQFHFCIKGNLEFVFNEGRYCLPLQNDKGLLLYNPSKNLPIQVKLQPKTWIVSALVSIGKLHALFSEEAHYIDFLSEENKHKKYYQELTITPSMAVVLSQIINFNLHNSIKKIYLKGKAYELIGLCFNRTEETDVEQCPFLIDEDNVKRIRQAKEIILKRMAEPPTLQELSEEIGLSLKKLKEGFKEIYGDTVFGFLFDYKMDYARKLLETGKYNVNEVGLKVGYSTASHFIAAFKKKFGTTPKKYIQALS